MSDREVMPPPIPAGPGSGPRREVSTWLIGLVLILPAMIPYFTHYLGKPPGKTATGFIAYDTPYYYANGREHFDNGLFRPTYGNPYDSSYETPRVYFQPMSLLLGFVGHRTGIEPGTIWVAFGFLTALCCARVALALYRHLFGLDSPARWLGLVIFFWGGGLLAAAGIAKALLSRSPDIWLGGSHLFLDPVRVFELDPEGGWWFLNFGRNLIFPHESLYHAIFLGAILCVLRERYFSATLLAFAMSISHPFTGIELLGILGTWAAIEVFFIGNSRVPWSFLLACAALSAVHLGYYLVFLNGFPAHRSLSKQWTLDWGIDAIQFLPAYALVGGFALWGIRRLPLAGEVFAHASNRLFLIWFLVVFAMSNHEFAVHRPVQPIHFTRGYDWIPLFFLGAPSIIRLLSTTVRRPGRPWRFAAAGVILAIFLADNALWFAYFPIKVAYKRYNFDIYITPDQREVMAFLDRPENSGGLLITPDVGLGYLSSVYTPMRSWSGHYANTPEFKTRQDEIDQLFKNGRYQEAWKSRDVLAVIPNDPDLLARQKSWLDAREGERVMENASYVIYRVAPAGLDLSLIPR